MAQLGFSLVPAIDNEPLRAYASGSTDRKELERALKELQAEFPVKVPVVINGERIFGKTKKQLNPSNHKQVVCEFTLVDDHLGCAIEGALEARLKWESMPFADRAAIFLKAADLLSGKYRYKVMAATMLGQGKNIWQAEIDAACELIDFWRFNALYAQQIYQEQPPKHSKTTWNRVEYRSLEGFVLAVSPFNFTAIGGNLVSAPAIMGNVVIWKPSQKAVLSNYLVYQILEEAGLPKGVIQFCPGEDVEVVEKCLEHKYLAALHFTGSTSVFRNLYKKVAMNMQNYVSYPRMVGETGGKNMHFAHCSADVDNLCLQTIRAAFEYQGQKCSACSRIYVPESIATKVKEKLIKLVSEIKVGNVLDFANFVNPVIDQVAFDRISKFVENAVKTGATCLVQKKFDDSNGYFCSPVILETLDPKHSIMTQEVFGPVLAMFVYKDSEFEKTLKLADETSEFGLTCAFFAQDREAVVKATEMLRHSAGNFYINDKCTGAVVGQQPFGGARGSGTNDKAGSSQNLLRWTSVRTIKETFVGISSFLYPSNE